MSDAERIFTAAAIFNRIFSSLAAVKFAVEAKSAKTTPILVHAKKNACAAGMCVKGKVQLRDLYALPIWQCLYSYSASSLCTTHA